MGVAYSSPDSPYTQLCVVYRCAACGGTHSGVGRHAGFLPRGWVRSSETDCVCPGCQKRRREGAAPTGRAST